jgi:hypothetical protein
MLFRWQKEAEAADVHQVFSADTFLWGFIVEWGRSGEKDEPEFVEKQLKAMKAFNMKQTATVPSAVAGLATPVVAPLATLAGPAFRPTATPSAAGTTTALPMASALAKPTACIQQTPATISHTSVGTRSKAYGPSHEGTTFSQTATARISQLNVTITHASHQQSLHRPNHMSKHRQRQNNLFDHRQSQNHLFDQRQRQNHLSDPRQSPNSPG